MCVCVCACVCVYFLSPTELVELVELLLTEQNNKCDARVQVRDGMVWNFFCIKDLCLRVKDNHRKNLQAGNSAKECKLNRAKPQEIKGNSCKLSKQTNGKSAKYSFLLLH